MDETFLAEEWGASLSVAWERMRERFPDVNVSELEFCKRAGACPPGFQTLIAPSELYLVCGCQNGQTAALRLFREHIMRRARVALARMQLDRGLADEAEQSVWAKFMVAGPDGELPIWNYFGKGRLGVFLQVSATRAAVSLLRKESKYVGCDDDRLANTVGVVEGADLALLRATYEQSFRTALKQAFAALSARQRTLLRLHHVDRVTGDELARMYRVHRATITRWLADARQRLAEETRQRVMRDAGVSEADFKSLMGVLMSRLDLSLGPVVVS